MHELGSTSRETIHREKEAFHSRVYEATANGGEKTENRGGPSTYWAQSAENGQKLHGIGMKESVFYRKISV